MSLPPEASSFCASLAITVTALVAAADHRQRMNHRQKEPTSLAPSLVFFPSCAVQWFMCCILFPQRVRGAFSQSSAAAGTAGELAKAEDVVTASWEMSPALTSSLLLPLAPLATISSAINAREAAHDASIIRRALVPLCCAGAPDLGATMPTAIAALFRARSSEVTEECQCFLRTDKKSGFDQPKKVVNTRHKGKCEGCRHRLALVLEKRLGLPSISRANREQSARTLCSWCREAARTWISSRKILCTDREEAVRGGGRVRESPRHVKSRRGSFPRGILRDRAIRPRSGSGAAGHDQAA